jgi:O-antigen/teichoic acid export membrane protein
VLKQKFLIHFGSNIVVHILGLFAGIIVARIAGPGVVGTIAYGTSYIKLWGFITGLFGTGHIKLISEGQDIGKCMSVYSKLFGTSVIVYFFVVISFFLLQKYIINIEFESSTQQVVIIILLSAHIFEMFYHYSSTTFTATMEQVRANIPFFVKNIIWHIGRIVIVLLGFKAVGLATLNLVVTILLLPIVYKLIKKYPRTEWDRTLFKRYIEYGAPILFIVVIHSIIEYSDKLFLAHFTNTTELGYYSAAFSIGGMIMIASVSIGNIFFPLFSSFITKQDWAAVNKKIMQYQEFLVIFVFPFICAIVIISGPLLITVLGPQYEPSIEPFMIIAFATYVVVVGMPYSNIITGAGRFYLLVWINIFKLVAFVFSVTIFVSPHFLGLGAVGLSLHLLLINLFTNLLYFKYSKKLSGLIFISYKNIIRYFVIMVIAIIVYNYQEYFSEWISFGWIVVIPVYLAIVYLLMFIFGLVSIRHFQQLIDLIDLRKIITYANSELHSDHNKHVHKS